MTRYELLMQSIAQADLSMVMMFLYALAAISAYAVSPWWITNEKFLKVFRVVYLAFLIAIFIFVTVYSARM